MKTRFNSPHRSNRRRLLLGSLFALLFLLVAASLVKPGIASSAPGSGAVRTTQTVSISAADTCATATVINPGSLPFTEESTLANAANDIDPGPGGCAPGGGADVVYSFTPAVSDVYTIGATPKTPFDLSLYVVTDCSNPAGTCVAGANSAGFDRGEFVTPALSAGTQYFIIVDTPTLDPSAAGFHFSLRRGKPANDTCATATVIDPSRLPFSDSATTFGAANDLNPGASCFTSSQSATGPDVVYQFTPVDTQLYVMTVTPKADYDISVYITTDCSTIANCFSADVGGAGHPEMLRHVLTAGTTYFIVIDGFGGDAGDFDFSLQPSIPHAPASPSDLTAKAVSTTQIDLAWRDNSGDEQGFRIQRSLDGFNFAEIASVGQNSTAFSDNTATANTLFFYQVVAFNGFGASDPSNIAFAQTPPNPVPVSPVIVVDPTSIDFGSVRVTQSDSRKITIKNTGGSDLIVSSISDPDGAFAIVNKPALPLTIASMQSITLTVRFSPLFTGSVSSSFNIQSNDPNAPLTTVNLTGVGAGAPVPNLAVSPGVIDFGTGSKPVTLELKNTGEADLVITAILGPASPFSVTGFSPGTLKAGEKKELTVNFSPTTLGVFTSGITIVSNDPDSLLTFIPVKGTSLAQTVVPNVVGLQFKKRGLRFQAAGSNVVAGAVLIVDGGETFALELNGDIWVVGKNVTSTPGNKTVRDIFVSPSTHTVVVKNPNGGRSAPVTISV
jgi:hypothetical protein